MDAKVHFLGLWYVSSQGPVCHILKVYLFLGTRLLPCQHGRNDLAQHVYMKTCAIYVTLLPWTNLSIFSLNMSVVTNLHQTNISLATEVASLRSGRYSLLEHIRKCASDSRQSILFYSHARSRGGSTEAKGLSKSVLWMGDQAMVAGLSLKTSKVDWTDECSFRGVPGGPKKWYNRLLGVLPFTCPTYRAQEAATR